MIASGAHLALACIDMNTGDLRWKKPGVRSGTSHLLADGLLFVRSYQTLYLIEATPERYRLLGKVHTHDVWKPTVKLTDIVCPVLSEGSSTCGLPRSCFATTWPFGNHGAWEHRWEHPICRAAHLLLIDHWRKLSSLQSATVLREPRKVFRWKIINRRSPLKK